jgi:glyoxylase-like metal-dependent hydrolase (beta-lactamase superfamily II)
MSAIKEAEHKHIKNTTKPSEPIVGQRTMHPQVHTVFEPKTGTWQYVVADPTTKQAVIIDSVLDYDPAASQLSTKSADDLLALVASHGYTITRILETHAHADHLTASRYLQKQLQQKESQRPEVCIGGRIKDVQALFGPRYGVPLSELDQAFDYTFKDGEKFKIGNVEAEVVHLPGHTPDHIGYVIGSNVFTGDSMFNPDVGSARCDFPGGSATSLYQSMQKLLHLPPHYRLYTGHDYPPDTREAPDGVKEMPYTTVKRQRRENKHVKEGTKEEDFVKWRAERDSGLPEPKLIHQSLQVNIRGGRLPRPDSSGMRWLHVPLKVPPGLAAV